MTRHTFVPGYERQGSDGVWAMPSARAAGATAPEPAARLRLSAASLSQPADPFEPFYAALERYFEAEDRALLAAFGIVEGAK